MSFDTSRFTFDAWNDYLGVVMQQGRVQIDSDWNEWIAEATRRIQAGTLDIIGPAAVPRATTPNGFLITPSNNGTTNVLTIGRGRIYVDGLLAENHGLPTPSPLLWTDGSETKPLPPVLAWDPRLAELTGTGDTPYTQQPYYPSPPALPTDPGPHMVYLDVWERELTHLQQPDLMEKAVGVDTAERLQTVWQVKVLADTEAGTTCTTDLTGLLAAAGIYPSGAQLTTDVASVPLLTDPCQVPNSSSYKGLENQLYRVEIHQDSTNAGGASFKWSRDNATVATTVNQITAPDTLVVQSVGKDDALRFHPLDWIEITDDVQELAGLPGEIYQIKDVQDATLTIILQTPLANSTDYPVDAGGNTDPTRHTRIRRWDQSGKVLWSDGVTVFWDLDNPANNNVPAGSIPLPPVNTSLILENGVVAGFSLDPNITNGIYKSRDYWAFAARTADDTVEKLTLAPPRGIHHHYTQLAAVTFPNTATSCRMLWPPISSSSGCCCTVSVSPTDLTGNVTLQSILDQYQYQYQQQPNMIICLAAGNYPLVQPLRLSSAHSGFTIEGCGSGAVFRVPAGSEAAFQDGMLVLDNALEVTLRGLQFEVPEVPFSVPGGLFAGLPITSLLAQVQTAVQGLYVSIGVRAVNATSLTVEKCQFNFGDFEEDSVGNGAMGIGIFGSGQNDGLQLIGNEFRGIGSFLAGYLLASAVSFNNPGGAPTPQSGIIVKGVAAAEVRMDKVVKATRITAADAAKAKAAVRVGAQPKISLETKYTQNIAYHQAIPVNLGILDTSAYLGKFNEFVPAALNLAANGGTVLPATLYNVVIKDNNFSGMTVAVLILAEPGAVEITGNRATHGAGFWIVAPQYLNLLLLDAPILFGSAMAVGYPLPAGDTSNLTQVVAASAPIRVYAGKAAYTDSQSNVWTPDAETANLTISTSSLYQPAQPAQITKNTFPAQDQTLYQSERYGTFSYTFNNVPNGYYQVTLKFAEIYHNIAGQRLMNVSINYDQVLTDFDVFKDAGGENIADDRVFPNIAPINGQIIIQFSGIPGSADSNAKIGAVEIASQLYEYPNALNDMGNFLVQLGTLGQQTFLSVDSPTLTLRIDGNTVDGGSAAALFVVGKEKTRQQSLVTINSNMMRCVEGQREGQVWWRPATAVVIGVNVCTVTGNHILNHQTDLPSLILIDSDKVAGVTVTGNVFQGKPLLPLRNLQPSVPAPMNTWIFLNTSL